MDINLIYSDDSIAVVEKPVGVPVQPDKTGDEDMLTALKEKFGYAGLIHRLDRPVGGLMVYALDKKAEAALSIELAKGQFNKKYLAVCCGKPAKSEGSLHDWLLKNQRTNMSFVSNKGSKNAKEALLDYKVLETVIDDKWGELMLLEIALYTGRHHQIRVQLANAKMPLWGDTKYNEAFKRGFHSVSPALYSSRLEFTHPKLKDKTVFERKPDYGAFSMFDRLRDN